MTGDVESFMLYKEMDQYGSSADSEAVMDAEDEWASADDRQ